MSAEEQSLRVSVGYGNLKAEFTGTPEAVLLSVNEFLSKQLPALDLAKKVSANFSLADLIRMFGYVVKLTPEGPKVWAASHKLSDKDIVGLQLVSFRIAHESGKALSRSVNITELQSSTGLKAKSISSRLSEMTKMGYVEKEASDQGVHYRITTQGIQWLSEVLSRKITKTQAHA